MTFALVHPWTLMRDGVVNLSNYQPNLSLLWHCAGHHDALDRCRLNPPKVLVVADFSPVTDVLFLLRRLKDMGLPIKVLVIGGAVNALNIEEYYQLGACGYLDYQTAWDDLVVAIRRVQMGDLLFPESLITNHVRRRRRLGHDIHEPHHQSLEALTNREREVLRLLALGESNAQIAESLFISEKTVKNHLSSLYKKLDVKDRTQAVIYLLQLDELLRKR